MSAKLLLICIITLAVLTRLLFLGQYPNGFTGDEAQQGYSAYSILKTGKDEWGQFLPIFPRGFGDYKPSLYTYLTIPSVAIFGLTIEAVRLPAALIGILSIVVIYFLAKELIKDEKIALWSSFLLAINPMSIQLSRTAWEGGLGILTFSLGLLFYLKSGTRNFILSAIFWGLTLYSYHSWRVFMVLFIAALFLIQWKKLISWKNWIAGGVLLIFILPIIFNLNSVLSRSSDVGIFSSQQISGYFSNKGVSPLPHILDKLLDNKVWFVFNQFWGNYLSYFSPAFYFSDSRSDNTYLNFPYFPLLYSIELILWLPAIFTLLTKELPNKRLLIFWFLFAPIPAALATGGMNANRVPTFLPLLPLISALGAKFILNRWKNAYKIMPAVFAFSFVIFLHFYLFNLPNRPPDNLRYGYDQIFKKTLEVEDSFDQIVISKAFTEPQIFVAFYSRMNPSDFQEASKDWLRYEKAGKHYLDQLESWNLGKFLFEDVNWARKDSQRRNALVISRPEDFPSNVESILDVKDPKGKVIYRMVPVKNEQI